MVRWRRLIEILRGGRARQDQQFRQQMLAAARSGAIALGAILLALAVFVRDPVAAMVGALSLAGASWSRLRPQLISLAAVVLGSWALGEPFLAVLLASAGALAAFYPLELLLFFAALLFSPAWLTLAAVLAAVAASAVLYHQRVQAFWNMQREIHSTEILSTAPLRVLLSENAKAISKLSAALTHELNSPLGALRSAVDTLLVVAAKQAHCGAPEEQQRLIGIQADLRRAIQQSAGRLEETVTRLQLFVDLEKAERQPADPNELLENVSIQLADQLQGKAPIQFDLKPVAPVMCRPQQLTLVFSSLLSNAVNATNGGGLVRVATEQQNSMVQVTFEDNGRGMTPEELENIFDPGFKVSGSRVATSNWSLFNSRQIVFEHGGDIRIDSAEGVGTTVRVSLPAAG
ncbi:MAG: HAMP domain-containing histidine kinase [Acidobacteria bacterium]|nr:HAMP domain-containing histidine kinase [Acidobacteriota bacterium]